MRVEKEKGEVRRRGKAKQEHSNQESNKRRGDRKREELKKGARESGKK